ncbi:hypothetical protein Vadar_034538 [Vaccinium darrowii]|uniref:Uncharacterized protein n=1 Tax=Vaccinium darrowii TaxID=229202 RepID=A0ACB7XM25_9ERIC|nr:hypothetical protein Vadar_034538 [Vaccinium darrowii]
MSEGEDLGRKLYEACVSGSVPALDSLIEKDELILNRVNSLTCFFSETPLHVAVLGGHLDFTKALLTRKPKLVTEFDTRGCSPLHLASTEGHVEIVRELLRVNTDVCIARDQDGRIPLHLAAMKGRVEVIRELLRAKPESIYEKLGRGETVLHLCVKYNRLEALETLLQYLQRRNDIEFLLNSGDDDGNTILHLAVALKQMETIKYLLGIKNLKDLANVKNKNGSTALDVLEHCPTKKTMEIRELLVQAGVQRSICGGADLNLDAPPDDNYSPPPPQGRCTALGKIMKWISGFWMIRLLVVIMKCISWFWKTYFDIDPAWLKEVRGHLITAATLTATMAYQAILSPPGSVWTDSGDLNQAPAPMPARDSKRLPQPGAIKEPGAAIMDSYDEPVYVVYLIINTMMLVASLSTMMLALSGFPVQNKCLLWLLIFTMYSTISCMAIAYFLVLNVVFPSLRDWYDEYSIIIGLLYIWFCVIALVLMLHACHFLVWLWSKLVCLWNKLVWLWNKFRNLSGRGGRPDHTTHEKSCCLPP